MAEHGWILLSVPEYALKCPTKLFWLCQGSQYAAIDMVILTLLLL